MTFCAVPVQNSGLAQSLNIADFELCFAGAAVGAQGKIYSLLPGQLTAVTKAFLAIGGTTAATSLTKALVNPYMLTIAAPEQFQSSQVPGTSPNATEVSNIATGLTNYFGSDASGIAGKVTGQSGGVCIGFCVQGLPIKQVLAVELVCKQATTMTNVEIFKAGPALNLIEPLTLGANSKIIKTGTTELAITDSLNLAVRDQLVFGSLITTTNNTLVPASGDILVLRIKALV